MCEREGRGVVGDFESNVCTLYFALRIAKTAVQLCVVVSVVSVCVVSVNGRSPLILSDLKWAKFPVSNYKHYIIVTSSES